ncbi:transcriptional regulator [Sphaerisporangium krabiense]|uniref:DNA-binding MurR/RpiR family transcriptional regulator n=1 Tax=Sphaerisporangium krabiense TaxID=763782 RepID=A0A7W8YYY7_9ACTN|nr:MurR/RpiR family transcriptional regulator [Sphaerisporangium krabiense]MBB5624335.1 DNA-binding MurR/RpiR family transcriptional regulator [Sphaerisporangium krabiense]GII61714.1 transcriptional regulator [Sphaerisporangium krabiense]
MADGLERLLRGRRLSPVQRRIAHYLSEHLPDAVFLSSVELAERAGVSQPSVTRFAMALGFAGYPEFRHALRPLVVAGDGPPENGQAPREADAGAARLLREVIDGEIRDLTAVRDRLAAGHGTAADGLAYRIEELGASFAACEPLPVLGLRVSSGLVTTFAYYARRIHPDVRPLVHGGSELTDGLHAARRAGSEWLLAVMLPRYPSEAVHALQYAAKLGFRTAVIADRPDVPFPADVVLPAPVRERVVCDSHAAPLAVAMLLLEAMAEAAPLRTRARLDEYTRMTDETNAFLGP